MLTVLEKGQTVNKNVTWLCKCDCGNYSIARSSELIGGSKKDCGCVMAERLRIEPGMKFGRLTVLCKSVKDGERTKWACRCDCGKLFYADEYRMRRGQTKSCGCIQQELRAARGKYHKRENRLYHVWVNMKQRCYNPKTNRFYIYGGRGITVCEEWLHDFGAFQDWAYANGYDDTAKFGECTIDRIDVNGNYEPSNCRWVDMKTQANNRRNNKAVS